jgi:hypothetical protein
MKFTILKDSNVVLPWNYNGCWKRILDTLQIGATFYVICHITESQM